MSWRLDRDRMPAADAGEHLPQAFQNIGNGLLDGGEIGLVYAGCQELLLYRGVFAVRFDVNVEVFERASVIHVVKLHESSYL